MDSGSGCIGVQGFQVVVIVDYNDNSRMFPLLSDDCPLCLLPVANRKILAYQLDTLVASGIKQVLIVSPTDYCKALRDFLHVYEKDTIEIDLIPVSDVEGSADLLSAVNDRIHTSDVIVISSDYISTHLLTDIANLHMEKSSDITVTCATMPLLDDVEKGTKTTLKQPKIDTEDQEFIGVCADSRLVIKTPSYEVEEVFRLSKPLLHRCLSLTLRNDLMDVGCYILSKWVIATLKHKPNLSSIRTDLLPYIVNRQFQKSDYIMAALPSLKLREKPLDLLEDWLSSGSGADKPVAMARYSSFASINETTSSQLSPDAHSSGEDIIRCFAVVKENPPITRMEDNTICRRITSLQAYMNTNRDFLNGIPPSAPWPKLKGYLKKELSVLGENSVLGDKVTIKQCSIGKDCKIGAKSKLNNCVLMDGVTIGESCTIQNSIICADVIVENNCNINDCQVGSKYVVMAGSKVKAEALN